MWNAVHRTAGNSVSGTAQSNVKNSSVYPDSRQAQSSPSGRQIRMQLESLFRKGQSEYAVVDGGKKSGSSPVLMFFCRMSPEFRISGPGVIDLPDAVVFLNQAAEVLQFGAEKFRFPERGAPEHPDSVDLRPDGDVLWGVVSAVC